MREVLEKELIAIARMAMKNAYAPYSKLKVGAAVLYKSGHIFSGCNVENASYGLTICAERSAILSAIANGERKFQAIAITSTARNPIPPCGACRQVMAEFTSDCDIVMVGSNRKIRKTKLKKLLPLAFTHKKV